MTDIKVFISSVQAEFAEERRRLFEYIRQDALLGQFFVPFIFENMPAVDLSAQRAYLQEAADSDIYLGLYGVRYGYEDSEGVSLKSLHSSDPTNPVIAHPLFLTGNIEHLGTGTTDMIRDCEAEGLKSPEFIQEEDFRVVIWRKSNRVDGEKVAEPTEKVTELAQKVTMLTEKVTESTKKVTEPLVKLTKKQQAVLEYCQEMPHSSTEILQFVGVKYQSKTVQQYVTKLVKMRKLRPTQVSPNNPDRKYVTAKD